MWWICALGLLHTSSPTLAQCPGSTNSADSPTLIHTRARSVLVDAVVLGTGDRLIDRSAFQLLEDGKPQRITSFEFHAASAGASPNRATSLSPFDPVGEERSNQQVGQIEGPINIILIDTLNTSMVDQQRNRKQIIAALQELPPGQPVALFSMGTELRMIQSPTERSDILISAAANMAARSSPLYVEHGPDQIREDNSLSGADFKKQALSLATIKDAALKAQLASQSIEVALAEQGTRRMDVRVALTMSSLARLAQFVQEYPGRKRLIWISGSFPISLRPDAATGFDPNLIREYTPKLKQLETELANAQIAVYAMDARGLVTAQLDASMAGSDINAGLPGKAPNSYQDREQDSLHSTQATLQELAQNTGGKAYLNQNDLSHGIREAMLDGPAYYSLSYQPPDTPDDGKYHAIELKVDGAKKSDLQYRRGYYAIAAPEAGAQTAPRTESTPGPDKRRAAFRDSMQQNAPAEKGITFKAKLSRSPSTKQTTVEYLIDSSSLIAMDQPDCGQKLNLVIGAVGWKKSDQKPVTGFKYLEQVFTPDAYSSIQVNGLRFRQTLEDSTNRIFFRLGVLDLTSGKIGTLDFPVEEKPSTLP
nr:VWA domain-containing protein [Granulicella aggregans]